MRMMIAVALSLFGSAFATVGTKVLPTVTIEAFADNSPDPQANTLYLWLANGMDWNNNLTGCSQTRAYIRPEDKHLQATLFTLLSLGTPIHLRVDNTKTKKDDGCQVVRIYGN